VGAITESYADNIVAYDAVLQLQFPDKKAYTDHWIACLSYAPDGMIFESQEPVIHADDNIAFSHNLVRCGCYDAEGNAQSSWTRVTRGYKKLGNQWKVIHEHFSFVIDMEKGNALFDIQP
jgi:ketosteroid isomerase-like protein